MWIDHVILGVRDLEEASARLLDEMGLASVPGGRHLAWGTANQIVPLGPAYVELLAVVDREAAGRNDVGRAVMASVEAREGLLGWCLGTTDLEAEAVKRGLSVAEGARELPTGETVRWRWAGFDRALAEPNLPFFITWKIPPGLHPGRMEAPHRTKPEGIAWVQVSGDEQRLQAWLEGPQLPVRVIDGRPAILSVGIATVQGEIVLR
ncbi:MAG TPA: VOC family protein [Actinomycetota bacterium]